MGIWERLGLRKRNFEQEIELEKKRLEVRAKLRDAQQISPDEEKILRSSPQFYVSRGDDALIKLWKGEKLSLSEFGSLGHCFDSSSHERIKVNPEIVQRMLNQVNDILSNGNAVNISSVLRGPESSFDADAAMSQEEFIQNLNNTNTQRRFVEYRKLCSKRLNHVNAVYRFEKTIMFLSQNPDLDEGLRKQAQEMLPAVDTFKKNNSITKEECDDLAKIGEMDASYHNGRNEGRIKDKVHILPLMYNVEFYINGSAERRHEADLQKIVEKAQIEANDRDESTIDNVVAPETMENVLSGEAKVLDENIEENVDVLQDEPVPVNADNPVKQETEMEDTITAEPESDAFSQGSSSVEKKEEYAIDGVVNKLKDGQTLSSEELVWISEQIANGSVKWSDDNSWVNQLLPQLEAEMKKSVEKGEASRDLRAHKRDGLFTVSQTQGSVRDKDAAQEANSTFVSRLCLEHMKIKKELPEGVNLDALIKEQREATNVSWLHPMKKLRSRRTLKSLESLQTQIQSAGTAEQAPVVDTAAIENSIAESENKIKGIMENFQTSHSGQKGVDSLFNSGTDLESVFKEANEAVFGNNGNKDKEKWNEFKNKYNLGSQAVSDMANAYRNIAALRQQIGENQTHLTAALKNKPKRKVDTNTFLASISNGNVQTPSIWTRIWNPQSREQSKDLNELLDKLPSSNLAPDGALMTGIDAEIQRLESSIGPDKKKNKEINRKIKKLQQYKDRIAAETKKRDDKFAKKEEALTKQEERLTSDQEKYSSSAEITRSRDELLQDTTLFSKTLHALEAEGFDVSALQELYRQQIKDRSMDEAMAGLTDEQKNILKTVTSEKESLSVEGESVTAAGQEEQAPQTLQSEENEDESPATSGQEEQVPQTPPSEEMEDESPAASGQEGQNGAGVTVEAQPQAESPYTPLTNIQYTYQVDGQEKEETYNGDAVSHSAEEDRYSIDLSKAQGEELDKACMATLAHMKESRKDSFRIDENAPVELYEALVRAAEASGMTIENGKELEDVMKQRKQEEKTAARGEEAKKEEPALTPEQQGYLVEHKLLKDDMTLEQLSKLKWSDLDKAQQELLNRDGLGREKEGAERPEQKDRQSEKTEPQTEQEQLLAKSEALKGIRSAIGTFDEETQRYNLPSEEEFKEKIKDLSPAEQKFARQIYNLQSNENQQRDMAQENGQQFKKKEYFSRNLGQTFEKAYEEIKKERGISDEQPRKRTTQSREGQNTPLPKQKGGAEM